MEEDLNLDDGMGSEKDTLSFVNTKYLKTAGKWARLLGILGIVFSSLALIPALISIVNIGLIGFVGILTWLLTIGAVVLGFVISLKLLRFGNATKNLNGRGLTEALKNMSGYFTIMGIISVVYLALIALYLIIILVVGVMR